MALKHLSDGSYLHTLKGSGVAIRITMPQIEKRMRRLAKQIPKIRERAWRTQINTIYNHLWKGFQAGGGKDGVPAFKETEPITKAMRQLEQNERPLGGKLWDQKVFRYKISQNWILPKASVKFGWIDGLASAAIKFQTGAGLHNDPFENPRFRRYLHIKGIDDVPTSYIHNPRDYIATFDEVYVKPNLQKWVDGYVRRTLANQIAREMRKARAA